MRNGERISGEIVAMAGGKLVVRTPYAGEITLEWPEVASLESERRIAVMFENAEAPEPPESGAGTTYAGRAAPPRR
jgi:hypothetical protein